MKKGYTLAESLFSLSLFLFIVLGSLQFFGFARDSFFKLKTANQNRENTLSALEKIRIDIIQGGLGLTQPIQMDLLQGIKENNNVLTIVSRDESYNLLEDLLPGQTRILLNTTKGLKLGREICIFDSKNGEIKAISSLDQESIVLSSPLGYHFDKEETQLLKLKEISIYLDEKTHILRRKVNNSPSQPLLEDVISFEIIYGGTLHTINLSLALKSEKETRYEMSVFPKNVALAFIHAP